MEADTSRSIYDVLNIFRRRAPIIALCLLVMAAGAFAFSKHQAKMYTATASLLFSSSAVNQQVAGLQAVNTNNQQSQQDTNVQLAQLGDMAAKTAATLDHGLTKQKVVHMVSISPVGDTNVVSVSAVSESPALAAAVANTYSDTFVNEQQDTNRQYYADALALVTKQLAALPPAQRNGGAGLALQDRAQSLATLAALRSGTVGVAQEATVPTNPSSPKVFRTTALAAFLGLVLGVGLAFLLERSDRLIREPSDLAAIYDLPLLGVVPESAALALSLGRNPESGGVLSAAESETFHLIRAHLRYFNVDRQLTTILVTSAAAGDGKTTLACHLAGAAVRLGSHVLLVEADLRRPTISAQLQLEPGPGLSDVLIGAAPLNAAIQTVALDSSIANGAAPRTLDVLTAGPVAPPNPAELSESRAMEILLESTAMTYDLVIIDTPPLTAVSDAFPLLRKVDGVIIVGRMGRDRRDLAQRTQETLAGVGAPLLGVIANGAKSGGRGYYGYGYGYGYRRPALPRREGVATQRENGPDPDEHPSRSGPRSAA